MKKIRNKVTSMLPLVLMLLSMTVPVCADEQEEGQSVADMVYTVGVVAYNPEEPEMNMFMNYYRDYLEEGFNVKFYFSDRISSPEEENEFINSMAELGAQGIISFYGLDVPSTVKLCEEKELYYVLGSGTISDEDFEAVEENPWFLGTVGPDPKAEYDAGKDMVEYFIGQGAKSFLVLTAGSSSANFMHLSRTKGILEGLQEAFGLDTDMTVEELSAVDEITTVTAEQEDVNIVLSPGYLSTEEGEAHLDEALSMGSYDALLCTMSASSFIDRLAAKEEEQGQDLQVGIVDCFSEENFQLVKDEDAYGNPIINYVAGKYASMAGPSFAMLYNAMSGHPEINALDGETIRLYQGFWISESREEYAELYGYTQGIYENAYSCSDLMQVIKVFNEDASPEKLKELTEAYTVEDVKARILNQ